MIKRLFTDNSKKKRVVFRTLFFLLCLWFVYLYIPFKKPLFEPDYSTVVRSEEGELLRVFLNSADHWCMPLEKEDTVPEKLKIALRLFEDEYFYYHPGVNPFSMLRALHQNVKYKKTISGASTINMQVCRIRKPKKRSIFNKILETFEAIKLNFKYSKNEIIQLYLNHAPYGGNIKGYRAATYRYFGKTPDKLSWAEASTLAVLPNAPGLISPGKKNDLLLAKRNRLLHKLYEKSYIDSLTYNLALTEPLPKKEFIFPNSAPHLAQHLRTTYPDVRVFKTTINNSYQHYISYLTRLYSHKLRTKGVKNAAVLVLDTKTGAIKSYVGSHDFFDFDNLGQIDGVKAWRSSGSILKPFLYALAFDEGIIAPNTLMNDVPTYYDGFSPRNSDKKFAGMVSANNALILSLNIPAVRLLYSYGIYNFYSFLKTAGLKSLFRTSDDYGLPLILGGCEVSMYDMAMLYRGLANGGIFQESYVCQLDTINGRKKTSQLISDGAAYQTLDIMKKLHRTGVEYNWQKFESKKPIAWKTGTSYGQKDGWAVGVTPQWTIAVWVGNFDGEGNPLITGGGSAAPLMFEILNYLPSDSRLLWFEHIPFDFKMQLFCEETGFLAGSNCSHTEYREVPLNSKPLKQCPYHKTFYVDTILNHTVCSQCWTKNYVPQSYLVYPADVVEYMRQRGVGVETVPLHNKSCNNHTNIKPVSFLYPKDSSYIWIPNDFDNNVQKLVAQATHNINDATIYWYLNHAYIGSTYKQHKMALNLPKGWHSLYVSDDNGYEDYIKFFVGKREKEN